jgi:rare lipoprotein A
MQEFHSLQSAPQAKNLRQIPEFITGCRGALVLGALVVGIVVAATQLPANSSAMASVPQVSSQSQTLPIANQASVNPPVVLADVEAQPKRKSVMPVAQSILRGMASWYGRVRNGHKTASGEIFDSEALTACHRTLPFGTMVKVTNLVNGQSVTVRINDRGVLNPDRVIDLSSGAADRIGMLRSGVAPVRLEVVARTVEEARVSIPLR